MKLTRNCVLIFDNKDRWIIIIKHCSVVHNTRLFYVFDVFAGKIKNSHVLEILVGTYHVLDGATKQPKRHQHQTIDLLSGERTEKLQLADLLYLYPNSSIGASAEHSGFAEARGSYCNIPLQTNFSVLGEDWKERATVNRYEERFLFPLGAALGRSRYVLKLGNE